MTVQEGSVKFHEHQCGGYVRGCVDERLQSSMRGCVVRGRITINNV